MSQKVADLAKSQQEGITNNFTVLISKLQSSIQKTKTLESENERMRIQIEMKQKEIDELHENVDDFMSRNRNMKIENNQLKIKINAIDSSTNLEVLSKVKIDEILGEELE